MTTKSNVLVLSINISLEPKGSLFFDTEELYSALVSELKTSGFNLELPNSDDVTDDIKEVDSVSTLVERLKRNEKQIELLLRVSKNKLFVTIDFRLSGDASLIGKMKKVTEKNLKKLDSIVDDFKKKYFILEKDPIISGRYSIEKNIDGLKVIEYSIAKVYIKSSDLKYDSFYDFLVVGLHFKWDLSDEEKEL